MMHPPAFDIKPPIELLPGTLPAYDPIHVDELREGDWLLRGGVVPTVPIMAQYPFRIQSIDRDGSRVTAQGFFISHMGYRVVIREVYQLHKGRHVALRVDWQRTSFLALESLPMSDGLTVEGAVVLAATNHYVDELNRARSAAASAGQVLLECCSILSAVYARDMQAQETVLNTQDAIRHWQKQYPDFTGLEQVLTDGAVFS